MHPAAKLSLDGFQLRDHPLLRRDAPDDEGSGLVTLPAVVGKAQEVERLRFTSATLLPITDRIASETSREGRP